MLVIRKEQTDVFEEYALQNFEDEMVVHIKDFSPTLCKVIGDDQVRVAVGKAINRSGNYEFTCRGPIRLFVEMTLLFGHAFDTDSQYPWAPEILHASSDQMVRADQLYDRILVYQERVLDPDPKDMRTALEGLSDWTGKLEASSPTEFVAAMLREKARISPKKTAYVGEEGLTDLILEGCAEAGKHWAATVHGQALLGMLMFTFGHAFIDDPLYPWAGKLLENKLLSDPLGRTMALEKEACAFLERMTAASQEGKQP
jgi:hypothetical protein